MKAVLGKQRRCIQMEQKRKEQKEKNRKAKTRKERKGKEDNTEKHGTDCRGGNTTYVLAGYQHVCLLGAVRRSLS